VYEEDTTYKDLAVIARIIWNLWRYARHQWLWPTTLATQEIDIRMIVVQSQAGKTVHETLSLNYVTQRNYEDVRKPSSIKPTL
jgi:hypothetical protein